MGFSFKSLFWGNKEEEVKKADLAKTKPVSKPVADVQARVVDMYSRVLPDAKFTPDPVPVVISTPASDEKPVEKPQKPKEKVIEFSFGLLEEMKENGLDVDFSDLDKPKKFDPNDPNSCNREHLRADSSEILDAHINVKTVNLSNPQVVSDDILSNISAGWLQIISTVPKEVGDKLSFDFYMGVNEFSFVWVVRSILTDPENNTRYGIQFENPPEDQIKNLNTTIGTAKLSKFWKQNTTISDLGLI